MTATSRKLLVSAAAISLVAAADGCGGNSYGSASAPPAPTAPAKTAATVTQHPVAELPHHPLVSLVGTASVPAGWSTLRTSTGSVLAYPPGWHAIHGDPGTASAAQRDATGRFVGYLNLTPRQGAESLSNWSTFRAHHNGEEGDRHVRVLAAARRLRVAGRDASCVKDSYTTSTGSAYVELACLIGGERSAVVVGAAPPDAWTMQSSAIERSISSVRL